MEIYGNFKKLLMFWEMEPSSLTLSSTFLSPSLKKRIALKRFLILRENETF